ncbi:MAG: hypothetical protein LBC44_01750 [Mycoplasmataceae bacterium]|jgi:hypothetical protein|nr:hypothetical protein [Mycoplasmataceae bacterium]
MSNKEPKYTSGELRTQRVQLYYIPDKWEFCAYFVHIFDTKSTEFAVFFFINYLGFVKLKDIVLLEPSVWICLF